MHSISKEELLKILGCKESTWKHKRSKIIEDFINNGGRIEKDPNDGRREIYIFEDKSQIPFVNENTKNKILREERIKKLIEKND